MRNSSIILFLVMAVLASQAAGLEVWIERPRPSEFVFGQVEVVIRAAPEEEVVTVQLMVDGRQVALFDRPPFRIAVDVGHENTEHEFKVLVRSVTGEEESAAVVTPVLQIDEIVDLGLQQLYVTVSGGGQRVLSLDRAAFRIQDEGKRQEIVTFERGDIPLTATLLLDCSLSMKGDRLAAALQGANEFVAGMKPLDQAMVLLFSDRLLRVTEFSEDRELLSQALTDVGAAGGTSINDHLFLALSRLEAVQGRRVVVLFSDGSDVHSVLPMEGVLQKARSSQALIFWIQLRNPEEDSEVPEYTSSWRNVEANRREFKDLREAIQESGGRIEVVDNLEGLEEAFAGILAELREQYVLGYYPSLHEPLLIFSNPYVTNTLFSPVSGTESAIV
ncbi:MAG: VWA domain-containing protein, partial [Nitrospirae bacterium]|nr:VWA domain-containing protein [Nitrospirota bacterium]